MNVEIPDELAIELADAHAATFSSSFNGSRLVEVVGKLLVLIPDPRAPEPIDVLDISVVTLVLDPAPKQRGKLTKHQRGVYNDIMRMSRRRSATEGGPYRYVWVEGEYVGSKNACDRLIEKGWIEVAFEYGPRGGEYRKYRPLTEEGKLMDPDAAWALLNGGDTFEERAQAAADLVDWLGRGGFVPAACPLKDFGHLYGFCCGFVEAAAAVRAMPEIGRLRRDINHAVTDGNTHHVVDSSVRLLEALHD